MAKAAFTWSARRSYFVTNGTSTANKIVVQALTRPGGIVLIDRNCHKSHHYGLVLAGARPVYLDAYLLPDYAIYGAVPLATIKQWLLDLKAAGELHPVRMLLLTNCTFDGVVANPLQVMQEVLAIKPDICFLWDEAWYAFATAVPYVRQRTAMPSARRLEERLASAGYRAEYQRWTEKIQHVDPSDLASHQLMADPDQARVRVYAHPVHPQVPVRAAAGPDDPRLGPGLRPAGPGCLPGGLAHPHIHLPQPGAEGLPDGAGLPPAGSPRPGDQRLVPDPGQGSAWTRWAGWWIDGPGAWPGSVAHS
jgi:Orn/Lys/Arg decarboxylase-like protein